MNGDRVLSHLRQLCHEIDAGRPRAQLSRWVGVPVAVPAALVLGAAGLGGCSHNDAPPTTPEGTPMIEERCDDGADDDADGQVDCADSDCADMEGCQAVAEYAAPMPDEATEPDSGEVAPVPDEAGGEVALYSVPSPE